MESSQILKDILSTGKKHLDLSTGIISNVIGNNYKIFACMDDNANLNPGDEFELENTYCAEVINDCKTKFYQDVADITEMLKHPCYLNTQLRAYIGTPIVMKRKIWGTLNYSSLLPHKDEYTREMTILLESQARNIATLLADRPK